MTTSQGEQLRKLLLDHGSFAKIEGVLEKWHVQKKKSAEAGGTVTKHWLMEVRKYTQLPSCTRVFINVQRLQQATRNAAFDVVHVHQDNGRQFLRMGQAEWTVV